MPFFEWAVMALGAIYINVAANVFLRAMHDGFMGCELCADFNVKAAFVRMKTRRPLEFRKATAARRASHSNAARFPALMATRALFGVGVPRKFSLRRNDFRGPLFS